MERSIDVSTVMGAHVKAGEVTHISVIRALYPLHLRLRVAGIYITSEKFLRDVDDLHEHALPIRS